LAQANTIFTPLEVKAFYLFGLLDDICQSVQSLVKAKNGWPEKYLPALSLFASAVDLLGRCVRGDSSAHSKENLRVGFWYLFNAAPTPPARKLNSAQAMSILVRTPFLSYTVLDLVALRNYCTHGQAAMSTPSGIDNQLLVQFPKHIGDSMEVYWSALQANDDYCQRLGLARVDPFANRADPLTKTLRYFSQGLAAGDLFYGLNWSI
jgi:hypothetical protein